MLTYNKTITTIENRLVIKKDEYAPSPRVDMDNLGLFITKSRNYRSPDSSKGYEHFLDEHSSLAEHYQYIINQKEVKFAFVIDRFEHGHVVYCLEGEGPKCRFDRGMCGFYIVFENDETKGMTEDEAKKIIRGELDTYNKWVNDEIYMFTLYDEQGELVECIGGFYDIESIKKYLPVEWKDENLNDYIE